MKKPAYKLPPGCVLILRTCDAKLQSYGGFQWPKSGQVKAPDWEKTAEECGNGLHGWLWGAGNGELGNWAADAKWLVVEVQKRLVIDLNDKVKFPSGKVVFVGDRSAAAAFLEPFAPTGTIIVAGTATAGDGGTATAGDRGTATAGYRGTATAGYAGTATAGDGGTATAGYAGTATAGYRGTATAGDRGTATAGYRGTATAGDRGTATAGVGGTATAGVGGTLLIKFYDSNKDRYRIVIGYVGEDGLLPDREYIIKDGKLILKGGK